MTLSIPIPITQTINELIVVLRKAIRVAVSLPLQEGKIDNYEEKPYNETFQRYDIYISFNEGDDRVLRVMLDLDPDPE